MKKVYVLIDIDSSIVFAASKTKTALKEKLCDMFMEDFRAECQQAVDEHWIDPQNPSEDDRIFIQQTWDCLMTYYDNIQIEKVMMI